MKESIKLGMKLRDVVTGFEGIAVSRTEFLNGCERVCIAPPLDKEGKLQDERYFDVQQLQIVEAETPARTHTEQLFAHTGGDRADHPNRSKAL